MSDSDELTFEVAAEAGGERLDRALAREAEARGLSLSRTRLKALIEAGEVSVDGAPSRDASRKIAAGATIRLVPPPPEETRLVGEAIPLTIVFEDEHLVIIDKPAGLVVHPAPGHPDGTLVNALIAHCGESLSGIGGVKRPGIVHRLDKDTSGLMVVAKNDATHQGLSDLFADHGRTGSLVREYIALAWGPFEGRAGTVDAHIGRHKHHRDRQAVLGETYGRFAVTHWRVEETLGAAALVTCQLETGRTHQIRVHLSYIGHPLLGDSVYGNGFKTKANRLEPEAQDALKALGRQALHAAKLGFEHPITGETILLKSRPPEDFRKLAAALRA